MNAQAEPRTDEVDRADRKSTRLNSSHLVISYAVFCLKKKKKPTYRLITRIKEPTIKGESRTVTRFLAHSLYVANHKATYSPSLASLSAADYDTCTLRH